ncbi:MAG: hypothetical protein M9911_13300 [Saprospiraceae bacterium]|nr:hypothetical protein [Saprospiraceae bacterium]
MKIFLLIFSLYFLALTIMPCKDMHLSKSSSETVTFQLESKSNHLPIDNCSPFCMCNCCGAFFVLKTHENILSLPIWRKLVSEQSSFKDINFISSYKDFIWQPPKIG